MRGARLVTFIVLSWLSHLGQAQWSLGGNAGQGAGLDKRLVTLSPGPGADTTSAPISRTQAVLSFTTTEVESSRSKTKTRQSSSSSTIASSAPTQTLDNTLISQETSTTAGLGPVPDGYNSSTANSAASQDILSGPHKTLVIVLSTVLGSIGLILAVLVLFLVSRHRSRRSYRHGVSPINDDEIESWRKSEKKKAIPYSEGKGKEPEHCPNNLANPVDWTTSPTTIKPPQSAILQRGASFHAKAPNARAGLTDEAVPGAEPFVPPVKRQSSRLSKAPPGHRRTKSRRSSTSAKSVRSMRSLPSIDGGSFRIDDYGVAPPSRPDWFYSEENAIRSHIFAPTVVTSSPATSVYNEVPEPGGLSPRPSSRPWGNMVHTNDSIGKALS